MEEAVLLEGSCRCGKVSFALQSHTPQPYMRCYCSICRKTDGGGGFAINIMGVAATLEVEGKRHTGLWHAEIDGETSPGERHFCRLCGTPLWVFDERWAENVYPFASAIDTKLPRPPETVHIMLNFKPPWVTVPRGRRHTHFPLYPEEGIADWHKKRGLWVD